jgi:hypothetical protein
MCKCMVVRIFVVFSFSYSYSFFFNQTGNTWQNDVNDDGVVDPYGSKAIHHGAIGRVLHGAHYDRSKPVYITQEQFGFFIYVVSSILLFYVILLIHGCA